jgi:hypothetical protein
MCKLARARRGRRALGCQPRRDRSRPGRRRCGLTSVDWVTRDGPRPTSSERGPGKSAPYDASDKRPLSPAKGLCPTCERRCREVVFGLGRLAIDCGAPSSRVSVASADAHPRCVFGA